MFQIANSQFAASTNPALCVQSNLFDEQDSDGADVAVVESTPAIQVLSKMMQSLTASEEPCAPAAVDQSPACEDDDEEVTISESGVSKRRISGRQRLPPKVSLEGLDYVLINPQTSVVVGAFLLPADLLSFARDRHDTALVKGATTVRLELAYANPREEEKDAELAQELIDVRRKLACIYARS
jgi:hypothetical protein